MFCLTFMHLRNTCGFTYSKCVVFVDRADFSAVMVPLQSSLTVTLPTSCDGYHNVFPGIQPTIVGFENKVS